MTIKCLPKLPYNYKNQNENDGHRTKMYLPALAVLYTSNNTILNHALKVMTRGTIKTTQDSATTTTTRATTTTTTTLLILQCQLPMTTTKKKRIMMK
jgi:hypothetical protein